MKIDRRYLTVIVVFFLTGIYRLGFSQSENFDSWSIDVADLTNGGITIAASQTKTIHINVTVKRPPDINNPGNFLNVTFNYKLSRKTNNGTSFVDISTALPISTSGYPASSSSITFSSTLSIVGSVTDFNDSHLVNGDQIFIMIEDDNPNNPTGWYVPSTYYNVTVTPPLNGNNIICCNQCILKNHMPAPLGSAPGTQLKSNLSIAWEYCPDGHDCPGYPPNGNKATCNPPTSDSKVWYHRRVGSDAYSMTSSNLVTIFISPLTENLTIPSRTYSSSTTENAYYITVNGDLKTNEAQIIANIVAANSITISSDNGTTRIFPGINLVIDPSTFNCDGQAGAVSFHCSFSISKCDPPGRRTTEIPALVDIGTNNVEEAATLIAFPNPTNEITVVRYNVAKKGSVTIYIIDESGKLQSVLLNKDEVLPGEYEIPINAKGLTSGVYLCVMEANGFKGIKKIVVTP